MATLAGSLAEAKLDERSYQAALKRLEKYEGRKFTQRMEAAYRTGTQLTVSPMRRRAPKKTGLLAGKISVRKRRPPTGYFIQIGSKSRAPHAGLVSKGHRIVTPGGRDTGRRARANPFVEETISGYEGRVISFITNATTKDGTRTFGTFGGF